MVSANLEWRAAAETSLCLQNASSCPFYISAWEKTLYSPSMPSKSFLDFSIFLSFLRSENDELLEDERARALLDPPNERRRSLGGPCRPHKSDFADAQNEDHHDDRNCWFFGSPRESLPLPFLLEL